jgi:hypothetical protein
MRCVVEKWVMGTHNGSGDKIRQKFIYVVLKLFYFKRENVKIVNSCLVL